MIIGSHTNCCQFCLDIRVILSEVQYISGICTWGRICLKISLFGQISKHELWFLIQMMIMKHKYNILEIHPSTHPTGSSWVSIQLKSQQRLNNVFSVPANYVFSASFAGVAHTFSMMRQVHISASQEFLSNHVNDGLLSNVICVPEKLLTRCT